MKICPSCGHRENNSKKTCFICFTTLTDFDPSKEQKIKQKATITECSHLQKKERICKKKKKLNILMILGAVSAIISLFIKDFLSTDYIKKNILFFKILTATFFVGGIILFIGAGLRRKYDLDS